MKFVQAGKPAVILAPMEGVTDAPMRALLTELGGFAFCVTEFFRISQNVPGSKAFRRHVPELAAGARTPSGVPVQIQLLGGDPERLAQSALRACLAGAPAIDLNFGCPAPTVNRHDGGATLLKYPSRIRAIVEAVRRAVPREIPVSAKLRLGWDSLDPIHENADMAAQGGASWITIHGRTKIQGYAPPAHWEPIGQVRHRLGGLPVVANGDIWSLDDWRRCRDVTGSEHFMLGRSALANPALQLEVARELGIEAPDPGPVKWAELFQRLALYCSPYSGNANYPLSRVKQWIKMIALRNPSARIEASSRALTLTDLVAAMTGDYSARYTPPEDCVRTIPPQAIRPPVQSMAAPAISR